MTKWDYSAVTVRDGQKPTDYEAILKTKGAAGWELVTTLAREGWIDFFFKQEATEVRPETRKKIVTGVPRRGNPTGAVET
jgi:hypothetical protein